MRTVRQLWSDQRGLGAIELIVVLVLIVALSVAFWNLFGNDVACRFSEAITSFDDAKRPAGQCMDSAAHGNGNAAGGASGAGGRGGKAGTSSSGSGSAGATGRASGSSNTAGSHTSAAPQAVAGNAAPPQALPPSAPQPSASSPPSAPSAPSAPSPPSPPTQPSIGDRIESALASVGQHAVDFGEGVIAGANPLAPVMPVELKPTFGNQVTFGTGQIVGSLVGLLDDAGNTIAGAAGMVASSAVLVLSDGTLVWVALPGFGASSALTAVGVAGAAGHGTNFMQGIDNVAHGENAPSKPSESAQGGSSSPEKPPATEPTPATEKPSSASNAEPGAKSPKEEPTAAKTPESEQPSSSKPAKTEKPVQTENGYVKDYSTDNTVNRSAKYASERDARSFARTQLGRDPVQVAPGKLRSQDGRWQYRGKPEDLNGHGPKDSPHVHLERLNPKTGEVLENWHLRW
jgi:Flp pilus assembly pilin Flp